MMFTAAAAAALLGYPLLFQQIVHLLVTGKWMTDAEYATLLVDAGAVGTTASDISDLFRQGSGRNLGAGSFGVWRDTFKPKGASSKKKYTMLVLNAEQEVDTFVDRGASSAKDQHGAKANKWMTPRLNGYTFPDELLEQGQEAAVTTPTPRPAASSAASSSAQSIVAEVSLSRTTLSDQLTAEGWSTTYSSSVSVVAPATACEKGGDELIVFHQSLLTESAVSSAALPMITVNERDLSVSVVAQGVMVSKSVMLQCGIPLTATLTRSGVNVSAIVLSNNNYNHSET